MEDTSLSSHQDAASQDAALLSELLDDIGGFLADLSAAPSHAEGADEGDAPRTTSHIDTALSGTWRAFGALKERCQADAELSMAVVALAKNGESCGCVVFGEGGAIGMRPAHSLQFCRAQAPTLRQRRSIALISSLVAL